MHGKETSIRFMTVLNGYFVMTLLDTRLISGRSINMGISAAGDAAEGERIAPFFGAARHKKTGPGTPGQNPVLTCPRTTFSQCLNKCQAY
jgi:hypothetical protein